MANFKSGGPKGAKKSAGGARGAKSGPKAGGKSPKHRGYRPEEAGPAKKRWNQAERDTRRNADIYGAPKGERPTRGGDRPNWEPRDTRGAGRDDRGGRTGGYAGGRDGGRDSGERGGYARDDRGGRDFAGRSGGRDGGRDAARSGGRDFGGREERTSRFDSSARFERHDRADRNDRGGRPERGGDRFDRSDRPARSFDRNDRNDRGNDRGGRPSYGRDERPGRPAYGRDERDSRGASDRPARSFDRDSRPERGGDRFDRGARTERPAYGDRNDRGARPAHNRDERPARGGERNDRFDRPARSFDRDSRGASDRPARSFDRNDRDSRPARNDRFDRAERPARSFDRDARPARSSDGGSDSKFYPSKERTGKFVPAEDVVLERLEAQATVASDADGVSFGDLGLGANIERVLAELGAASPFPIQAATIPEVLAGKDVLGRGKTGSGKTIAFGAPVVERLLENQGAKNRKVGRSPRALIMAPTRELAMQIDRTVQPIARSVGLFTITIVGGVPQQSQVGGLRRGVDIVIGTPGRIEDLVEQGKLDLSETYITVLDEADHMCDLGFLEPVQRILRETADIDPAGRRAQHLLFSATLDKGVATLVDEFLTDPSVHEVAGEDQASSTIDHRVLLIEHRDKPQIIEQLADREGKTLIFTRTRAFAEQLTDLLEDAGIRATSLHGDLNQNRRTRNLERLTSGRVNVLVATDVAARGIHVDDIDLVIQADAPDEYKTYLHRAGRTGRAGKEGTVVTLVPRNRRRRMDEMLDRAEINAEISNAAPGDQILVDLAR